jgi:large subunit ribosomal protein L1
MARIRGLRGIIPNPKSGTVYDDIMGAVHEIKARRVEFKMHKTANMAVVVGKRSFPAAKLAENISTAIHVIVKPKPTNISRNFMKNVTVTATMAPEIRLEHGIYSVVSERTL